MAFCVKPYEIHADERKANRAKKNERTKMKSKQLKSYDKLRVEHELNTAFEACAGC